MKVSDHLLRDPGRQDLTAHVNFDAVIESGSRYGFVARELVTQAEYLIDLGIGSYLPSLAARRSIARFAYEAEREAVTRLLDPREMGSFRVLELERIPASERDGVLTGGEVISAWPILSARTEGNLMDPFAC